MGEWMDEYEREIIGYAEGGDVRVSIARESYPGQPVFACGHPVLEVYPRGGRVRFTGYGALSEREDGIGHGGAAAILTGLVNRFGVYKGVGVFDRYLRAFHGGSAVMTNGCSYVQDFSPYVAYSTRAMVESWGNVLGSEGYNAGIVPTLDEWQAYIDGDVFVVVTERKAYRIVHRYAADGTPLSSGGEVEWLEEDSVGGFYGERWAREEAESMVDYLAGKVAPAGV